MMAVGTTRTSRLVSQCVLDSGASHQMTCDASLLEDVEGCTPVDIRLADGRVRRANESGTATISVP